ncbi:SLATT domain-containing protein [Shewanella litoralis]|uniref:SLATT domain-containing protein n=1 Tax=Shewanella litoralis TaxID=2282700 RepID=A0ABQ2RK00_9GAMM|nr:SLATT domain-containing protein [Shewanella litoralis]GGQ33773.1 hypothetical protein GCM10009411_36500 [Shewanella litoralis]
MKDSNDNITELAAIPNNIKTQTLITNWIKRLHDAQIGHYTCSEQLYNRANLTGYALILSSTVVTAMLFMDAEGYYKLLLVFMSILSAILSGVVSFARFAEKAEQHRAAASCYGKLRRQLEKLNTVEQKDANEELNKQLKILRIEWEYTSRNAPLTPLSAIEKLSKN